MSTQGELLRIEGVRKAKARELGIARPQMAEIHQGARPRRARSDGASCNFGSPGGTTKEDMSLSVLKTPSSYS
ncbi:MULTISPECIES: hypothetical protein [unclassified Streptomyces]|uniref:hypothetical protein n=1 Tax=unclassified Streptomyces TaxID=2593676 RepID=UPI0022564610|nr:MULTISPECIES: hypothetical protein [unclassified Streptomyces]WSP58887.1 hypothetical protein OG306_34330 [Streptomyces sp. NBC_01241]WSU20594.1 hypothetical protein OG508_06005 [Streptomyces sp. NBC_01108]MCX4790616.1 hypothetical protein [Streptomyces sp. NBC_01221]MCX4793655.1 hypothetical protein [Streptomyces sp. NBC_01242]WSJ35083.1 hypothetical protein OG772_02700 [Streptomyces sp. NBC_01321]